MNSQHIEEAETSIADAASRPSPTKAARRERRGDGAKGRASLKKRPVKPKPGNAGAQKADARNGTKQSQLITLLRRADGVTVDEVVKALGWQPHTVRGAISGALRKKLSLRIESEKAEGRGRVYRIVD